MKKIKFLPNSGFGNYGAIVEYEGDEPTGEEPQYQRVSYIDLYIKFENLNITTSYEIINEYDETTESDRSISKVIAGKGVLRPARWGEYSLSFLGHESQTKEVSLTIRSNNDGESTEFGGLYIEPDMDLDGCNDFYIQINLHRSRFDLLASELAKGNATLNLSIDTSKFPKFYAVWSPSISEGRVIKYLNDRNDIENVSEIPNDFWVDTSERRKRLSDRDNPPVVFGITRPLNFSDLSTKHEDETKAAANKSLNSEDSATAAEIHLLQAERNSAILAQTDATTRMASQIKRTGIWITACLFCLVLAVLIA
ncbi:hypothetical protein OU789_02585 [Halocynthiibacter sp. C4]|uniref:hypothetical protein n=1 Tax=Halocynthiibacter sp. C4 TaxID=2992758 RepID=UPI00237C4058|nr:hypothetical protein [Halocynthiibacter sp. C4]MDE0588809.1 hypothetical protein [Halocynthiibacter sp. C4]